MADFFSTIWHQWLIHVVDILLLAYILYRLFLLLRGTRGEQVIIGLVVLAVATLIIQRFLKLPTLSWLLSQFWWASILIIAVVFHPELRAAFAQLGSPGFVGRLLFYEEYGFINEIISSVKEASERRRGMLIVLEQSTGLRNFVETGTILNAEISRELILSIFQRRSLLHDGAIIIQESKIMAASCVLPLSSDPGLSKILGTRHRAAVGVTEISDAVVIVISEETGQVSVARSGKLDRGVDPDVLRARLVELYRNRAQKNLFKRTFSRA